MPSLLLPFLLAAPVALAAAPAQDAPTRPPVARPQGDPDRPQEEEPARPGAPPRAGVDVFGRPVAGRSAGDELEGCWQLIDIQLAGFPDRGRQGSGLLLVHGGFLALELHLSWPGTASGAADLHQTFLAECEVLPDRTLRTRTLIGSFLDDVTGQLEWERAGTERRYGVELVDARTLALTFGQGNRMAFTRRAAPRRSAGRDVFGRGGDPVAGERDVFGRPVRRPAPKPEEAPPGGDPGSDGGRPGHPGSEPPGEVDVFGRRRTRRSGTEGLDGCWQLVELQLADFPTQGRDGSGLVLVHEGVMAFELHVTWPATEDGAPDLHQTFLAEVERRPDRGLRAATLIGSFLDDRTGALEWERSGLERHYVVERCDAESLVLSFGQGNRMAFVRRRPAGATSVDVFGRKVQDAGARRDVFGRPVTDPADRDR